MMGHKTRNAETVRGKVANYAAYKWARLSLVEKGATLSMGVSLYFAALAEIIGTGTTDPIYDPVAGGFAVLSLLLFTVFAGLLMIGVTLETRR